MTPEQEKINRWMKQQPWTNKTFFNRPHWTRRGFFGSWTVLVMVLIVGALVVVLIAALWSNSSASPDPHALPPAAAYLILAGGVLYSIGVVFHLWDNLRFQNAIWHGFALSAAGLQFIAVFEIVSQAAAAAG